MEDKAPTIEEVFAEAVELPTGEARQRFVAERCAGHPHMLADVNSLLLAHEGAAGFLEPAQPGSPMASSAPSLHPAIHAEAFLQRTAVVRGGQIQDFLATLPAALRPEAGERIAAGLRVRDLRTGNRLPDAEPVEPPPALPGFQIERPLGAGGLGVVYAAHDTKLNRRVAIKVLRQRADAEVRRRVLDEARKTAALEDPAIVTIYSVLDDADPPAIVMELVEGFPIDRFAERLTMEQKARLLHDVVRGLGAAHGRGLIHRDLKPDNVVVGPDLRPRILDFGLALSLEEARRQGQGFEGTPLYASPEQVLAKPLGPPSDVFSFGSLMFKVLTGRAPFAGETITQVLESIATTAPPFLRDVAVGIPEDLQAICLSCLAWNPADRPTAPEVAIELGRFLVGEPVRLKPKLYGDLLRRSISEYASQAQAWESQSIISSEERDSLEIVHRRLLADEDHWIIDARRITALQALLSGATWLTVVATVLTVWMLRDDLASPWRWLVPTLFTAGLLGAGQMARREKDPLAAATFLAGAALSIAPCTLALLAEARILATPFRESTQLFEGTFTNEQVMASALTALAVSAFALVRLKMTGFAWTSGALGAAAYISVLLPFNWMDRPPEIRALWCLPLAASECIALALEKRGRVRWTLPFHIIALLALVVGLDVMAAQGPTLKMLGVTKDLWRYFDAERLQGLSLVMNGLIFLVLMLAAERSGSLDLRRAGKVLEVLAIVHTLGPLFANAMQHKSDEFVRLDVGLYLVAAILFTLLAPLRSRWRLLVGGLAGCGLGSYLLVELELVAKTPFILGLGFAGMIAALGTFAYVRRPRRR